MMTTHPLGYDAALVRRVVARGASHRVANVLESYWAACHLARYEEAAAFELELRALIPPTHVYVGPGSDFARTGERVIFVLGQGRYRALVRALDDRHFVCLRSQLSLLASSADAAEVRCVSCGDSQTPGMSFAEGRCGDCRGLLLQEGAA